MPQTLFSSGLTSVTIGNSVTSIGGYAFCGCYSLTSVTIGNSVKSIGDHAFDGCHGLTSVTIPNSVESIGGYAFFNCSGLTSVTIPNSVTSIGGSAFSGCSGLTSVTIGNSVTSIGGSAFSGCSGLTSIHVESGNKTYDSRDNCNAIIETSTNKLIAGCKNTVIPNSVTSIGYAAFSGCSGLTSVTIPNSVTRIEGHAFSDCSGLTSVTISNSVTSIGEYAFYRCSGLRNLTVEWDTPLKVSANIFGGVSLKNVTLYVPEGTEDLYYHSNVWHDFGAIVPVESDYIAVDADGTETRAFVKPSDCVTVDDALRQLTVKADIKDVSITYTRDFSTSGNWQAWFVPFDVAYDDMSRDYEVAQIQDVLTDETGKPFIAFSKMTGGVVKGNTPYVVKPRLSGEKVTETTSTLYRTADARPFTIQSAVSDFTFGGVYEETLCGDKGWYALNNNGGFQRMGESVYLRPFRVWMTITPREDNPYAIAESPDEVKMMVMDEATGIDRVGRVDESRGVRAVNLAGQTVGKDYKGVVIINGRKYMR